MNDKTSSLFILHLSYESSIFLIDSSNCLISFSFIGLNSFSINALAFLILSLIELISTSFDMCFNLC